MKLLEVKLEDKKAVRRFLEVPAMIYRDDPHWIRPLDQDIERVFDPKKNKFWRHGTAIRWILVDDRGADIGRVAAFINERTAKTEKQPTGGMGFFECIHDAPAANLLFDACREWLVAQGMEAMDGPVNFGERDAWWGLLVEGRHEPVYQMNYQPAYYQALFEQYGFQLYFKQFVFYRNIQDPVHAKFLKKYDDLIQDPGYHFKIADKRQLEKFAEDFRTIYNNAWGGHDNFKMMRPEQSRNIMRKLKPILAPELAIFGYYHEEPVGFFIMIPDMNQIFKKFNGKFGLWQKLRTWWMLRRKSTTKCYGIVFGVVRNHQSKGVDGGLITAASHWLHPQGHWDHMEMTWIGDFNPKMINVATGIGGEVYKTYHTLRYLFDREKPFERHPIIGGESEAASDQNV
ncbi:MAG: hypothetical protein AAGN35_04465 [Bacteroidota bacterium]